MEHLTSISRRSFIKALSSGATISLTVHSLPSLALSNDSQSAALTDTAWAPEPGKARWRIDGMRKVLGQKIYARDFTAKDFSAWPQQESWLYALRCSQSDKAVLGYDLSMLPPHLQPVTIIDAAALSAKKMPPKAVNMNSPFFTSIGSAPNFYGQPVAMLIFADFNTYRRAVKILQFNEDVIQYGDIMPPFIAPYSPATHYVRDDSQQFSYAYSADYNARQYAVDKDIRRTIKSSNWLKLTNKFRTQTIDPMFMEPEAGLAWYDSASQHLHLVLGTQSPTGDITDCTSVYTGSQFGLKSVDLISCYPGGGFGGRDQSYFPMYLAMAAAFSKGPLRFAFNRFEQFQVGLKRCATEFNETLAIDQEGMIQGLLCNYIMNSGGEKNLSPYVAQLAGLSSMNCYNIPRAVASGVAIQTRQLIGGSQRGFGGPQAFMAIETLLDEAAQQLKIDPFTLRRKNLLSQSQGKTITGAPITQDLQLLPMLDILEQHPLWQKRFETQKEKRKEGWRYGVGFAMSNEAYGTSGDGMFGAVQIDAYGNIIVHTPYVDMGNGAATALGLAPSVALGRNASFINMGEAQLFNNLNLTTNLQTSSASNKSSSSNSSSSSSTPTNTYPSNYVLKASGSSSACLGAFYQYHVVEYAGISLLINSILPAAFALWKIPRKPDDVQWQNGHPNTKSVSGLNWVNGSLTANNLPSLKWSELVKQISLMKLPTFAAVHASFVGEYATANFALGGGSQQLPLDYIAMGTSPDNLKTVTRSNLQNPPAINSRFGRTTYAPCGALVAANINPRTGEVKIEDVISVLSAGVQHCPPIVSGQSQGGIAMAIGNILLEDCPIDAQGPGNGTWNLNRYAVARATDMPRQKLIVLPPAQGETTARGIAEAVFCPIGPAILNALAMATDGKRFTSTPVTPQHILEALK